MANNKFPATTLQPLQTLDFVLANGKRIRAISSLSLNTKTAHQNPSQPHHSLSQAFLAPFPPSKNTVLVKNSYKPFLPLFYSLLLAL